mgnify:CR=1 FL=1
MQLGCEGVNEEQEGSENIAKDMAKQLGNAAASGRPSIVICIRMGPRGSVTLDTSNGKCYHIPAVSQLQVKDVTGCGNSFCGG